MHRTAHELLHTVSFVGASIATWAWINAESLNMMLGAAMAIGGALWSFYLSLRAKACDEARDARWKDFEMRLQMAIAEKEAGVQVSPEGKP